MQKAKTIEASELAVPEFTNERFHEDLIRTMMDLNLSFKSIDNLRLRQLFRMLHPDGLKIPGETGLRDHIADVEKKVMDLIAGELSGAQKVSIALDAWSAPNKQAYLAVTLYYISDDWSLRELLIGFEELEGQHTGAEIKAKVVTVLNRYCVQDRLFAITTDNASNNGKFTRLLQAALRELHKDNSIPWDARQMHIPCLAHVVQLVVNEFMKNIKIESEHEHLVNEESYKTGVARIDKILKQKFGFARTVAKVSCIQPVIRTV